MRTWSEVAKRLPITVALVAACTFWASGFCLGSAPAWSPDGTKLLYSYRIDTDTYGLALHDRTSGETRTVRRFPKGVSVDWVGWRPDGEMAVLNTGGQILQLDPVWVEKVEIGGLLSGPRPRTLWKWMREKLASHVDELRREVAAADS